MWGVAKIFRTPLGYGYDCASVATISVLVVTSNLNPIYIHTCIGSVGKCFG